jgi:hypothetical protein
MAQNDSSRRSLIMLIPRDAGPPIRRFHLIQYPLFQRLLSVLWQRPCGEWRSYVR